MPRWLTKALPAGSCVVLALALASTAHAATYRVDAATGGSPPGSDGSGWGSDAFASLQDALAEAEDGDEVWVANGTYAPTTGTDRTISFEIPGDVTVYGGFAGNETALAQRDIFTNPTILSGAIGGGNFSYHVVKINDALVRPILNGLTITNGLADGSGTLQFVGGGLLANGGFVAVNCIFEDNLATYQGGAVYIAYLNLGAYFSNCVFRNNTAASSGDNSGGAVAIADDDSITDHGPITFLNCLFHANKARTKATCIYQGTKNRTHLINCTLTDNALLGSPPSTAPTVYLRIDSELSVRNSILWGNGDGGQTILTQGTMDDGSITITYTDLQSIPSPVPTGWIIQGTTVVDIDPEFVDAGSDDFRLDGNSPLINGGGGPINFPDTYDVDDSLTTSEPTPDLDHELRIAECFIDLGPYEFLPAGSCYFDLDDDGDVDGFDLALLLADWGACPGSGGCPADFDCNGVVDGIDMGYILGGWTGNEEYPRECEDAESAMGGGSESEPDGAALDEVLAALGLEDHDEFVVWLQLVGIDFAVAEIDQILSE